MSDQQGRADRPREPYPWPAVLEPRYVTWKEDRDYGKSVRDISADFFNIFNHVNFADPSFNINQRASFGVISDSAGTEQPGHFRSALDSNRSAVRLLIPNQIQKKGRAGRLSPFFLMEYSRSGAWLRPFRALVHGAWVVLASTQSLDPSTMKNGGTRPPDSGRIVGNSYLTRLRKSCPSSDRNRQTRRVLSRSILCRQTTFRERYRAASVSLGCVRALFITGKLFVNFAEFRSYTLMIS
jgi:hypothetical protein